MIAADAVPRWAWRYVFRSLSTRVEEVNTRRKLREVRETRGCVETILLDARAAAAARGLRSGLVYHGEMAVRAVKTAARVAKRAEEGGFCCFY